MEQFRKFTTDSLSEIKKLQKDNEKLEFELFQRVKLVTFDKMNAYVSLLPTLEQMNAMQTQITVAIRDLTEQNINFKGLFADNCAYVSRFDEVLSLKASKNALMES